MCRGFSNVFNPTGRWAAFTADEGIRLCRALLPLLRFVKVGGRHECRSFLLGSVAAALFLQQCQHTVKLQGPHGFID
ncbi:hypothetical protein SDC9_122462 [bioreactor metagenome]|uniref:Uncharacterized protein n=1 Tax=bioreactor metagenome TaxID=1076179 RepID=A0A645CES1_9ZZZZ